MLLLACPFAAASAATTYTVLHSFPYLPKGTTPVSGVIRDSAGNLYGTTVSGGLGFLPHFGVVYKLDPAGHETVLYTFTGGADGGAPYAGVILDSAGNLYGTTQHGGGAQCGIYHGCGVVFKLDPTGHETVLHSFTGGADGSLPIAGVILDAAGNLYGTTSAGGTANAGVVFKLDSTGQETVLYSFTGGADGGQPYAGVIRDPAGNLYGTTFEGGVHCMGLGCGVVFKLDTTGHETVLHRFAGGADGSHPYAGVTLDAAGNLYGTTVFGGTSRVGTVYEIDASGLETVLYSFNAASGYEPYGGVTLDAAGNLYGTTVVGGTEEDGTVYMLDPTGHATVLHRFNGDNGEGPNAGVIRDSAGNLYGTTGSGGGSYEGVVYELDPSGHETVLYSFPDGPRGDYPFAGVIRDDAGNLYGTASAGGHANAGVVYKLDATGHETVLYHFKGGADGSDPQAGVSRDSAGNLYGTTFQGGQNSAGVVYKLDPAGQETVLYAFTGGADGGYPYAGVIRDSAGNLYGTTFKGGPSNAGVVYKLDPAGQETVLYAFTGGADGGYPDAGVIRDLAGNLYGTTGEGGSSKVGVVYKLDPAGQETVLHAFTGGADGIDPRSGVILDPAGNLYGTTFDGGTTGLGIVYKLDPAGQETILYTFPRYRDGRHPVAGVILDSAGNLYGTTPEGGASSNSSRSGVVYMLDPAGQETVLHSFSAADGGNPEAGVILDSAGNLYGTAAWGGPRNGGVVFKLQTQ